jgi:hypothetical protein
VTGPGDAHPAPPDVSLEQLSYLLALGAESPTLDYKQSCNPSEPGERMEIAKDVAAMQILGGYLVIGADSSGTPVPPGIPTDQQPLWDEARLRPALAKYLPEPLELHTAVHTIDDTVLAIVRVSPNTRGLCVIKAEGKYTPTGKKEKIVFRPGDVFARHGTSSERWNQSDIDRIVEGIVDARKEQWRTDLAADMAALSEAQASQSLAAGPIGTLTWKLDAATFDRITLELFRTGDDIALRTFLLGAPAEAGVLLDANGFDDLGTLIGRLASLAANALVYRRREWFDETQAALVAVYRQGYDSHGYQRNDVNAPRLWLLVLEHVLALGAVAVRQKDWPAVRALAVQAPNELDGTWRTWLRHGFTMANRSKLLDDGGTSKSILTTSLERIAANPALAAGAGSPDEALTSLCQFDILAAVALIGASGQVTNRDWYPSFAAFYATRSEPAVIALLRDDAMRRDLFSPGDDMLADALRLISQEASAASRSINGWFGFDSREVLAFLDEHP